MSHPTFIIMPLDALMDDRLSLRQIRVLMAILSWRKANTNLAAVSREMIAERTGYPVSRVSAITSELEQLGWIKKHGSGGRSRWTRYEISEINPDTFGKRKETKGNVNSPKETVTKTVTVTDSETVTDLGVNGYQNGNETVTNSVTPIDTVVNTEVNTEDIYTPKPPADEKPKKNQRPTVHKKELVDKGVDEQVAEEYLYLRRQARRPLTRLALTRIENEAAKAGISLNDALLTCVERGWQSFNAEWVTKRKNVPRQQERFDPVEYINRNRISKQQPKMEELDVIDC